MSEKTSKINDVEVNEKKVHAFKKSIFLNLVDRQSSNI